MKSQKEVKKAYAKMLEFESIKGEVEPNRVNCYQCPSCQHITKTIDVDKGVTPFMHTCERCGSFARSTMYNDIAPHQEPTEEWYRPSLRKTLRLVGVSDGMVDHILQGGLDVRKIKTDG